MESRLQDRHFVPRSQPSRWQAICPVRDQPVTGDAVIGSNDASRTGVNRRVYRPKDRGEARTRSFTSGAVRPRHRRHPIPAQAIAGDAGSACPEAAPSLDDRHDCRVFSAALQPTSSRSHCEARHSTPEHIDVEAGESTIGAPILTAPQLMLDVAEPLLLGTTPAPVPPEFGRSGEPFRRCAAPAVRYC